MNKLLAVIGANYGDEGKGHIVDYLSNPESITVRFNGGAQAGHTVINLDGRRHVFHHFGSGSFQGAPTYLGKEFIINPMIFVEELQKLLRHKLKPVVYVHPDCRVSTPYDAMINQALELKRGSDRHGSCGLGIWETVLRNRTAYDLTYRDMYHADDPTILEDVLRRIKEQYVPKRCRELGIATLPLLESEGIFKHFLADCVQLLDCTKLTEPSFLKKYQTIVFEGAQGLRLDEDGPDFPYVSGSKTGLTNVIKMANEAGLIDPIEAYYVSRPYITRHGAGPLPYERKSFPMVQIQDDTNIPNEWQGSLRFALLDRNEFAKTVRNDLTSLGTTKNLIRPHLVITCADQVLAGQMGWVVNGDIKVAPMSEVIWTMSKDIGASIQENLYAGGLTRKHVFKLGP